MEVTYTEYGITNITEKLRDIHERLMWTWRHLKDMKSEKFAGEISRIMKEINLIVDDMEDWMDEEE